MSSKHAAETKQTETETESGPETLASVVAKIGEVLDEIRALLFSIRMQSPWITQREAERYLRCKSGALSEAIRTGELPTYRRTQTSTVLINVHELNAWVARAWIVRPDTEVGVSRA
ncbi:MAG: hypothetical protein Q4A07_12160 [Coriobacteriales bacterium]|nr:hypothetical protein [Coriobacteriales bacterium]